MGLLNKGWEGGSTEWLPEGGETLWDVGKEPYSRESVSPTAVLKKGGREVKNNGSHAKAGGNERGKGGEGGLEIGKSALMRGKKEKEKGAESH